MSEPQPFVSDDDVLIAARLMGECTHPSYDISISRRDGYTFSDAVCSRCSRSVHTKLGETGRVVETDAEIRERLRETIAPHTFDIITVRVVLRHVEANGWDWTYARIDSMFQYTLARRGVTITGLPAAQEHKAIANALVALAKQTGPFGMD